MVFSCVANTLMIYRLRNYPSKSSFYKFHDIGVNDAISLLNEFIDCHNISWMIVPRNHLGRNVFAIFCIVAGRNGTGNLNISVIILFVSYNHKYPLKCYT